MTTHLNLTTKCEYIENATLVNFIEQTSAYCRGILLCHQMLAEGSTSPARRSPRATDTEEANGDTTILLPVPSTCENAPLTFAHSVFATQEPDRCDEEESKRISAYAKLDFDSKSFYIQTLQVILGRKAESGQSMVDVDLGPSKSISRRHAKIFYNFATQRFELTVIGRNGLFVNETWHSTDTTVPLADGTSVQIGEIAFKFVLPEHLAEESHQRANDNLGLSMDVTASPASESTSSQTQASHTSGAGGSSFSVEAGHSVNLDPALSSCTGLFSASQSLGSYDMDVTVDPSLAASKPKQKMKVKSKAKLEVCDENNFFAVTQAEKTSTSPPPKSHKRKRKEYKPEDIPEEYKEKPSHSYSYLITAALREGARDVGMSLSDIYEGIMVLFPYYRYCPPGWQNSVRHNLSSSKSFRKVSKEGKGWFWGLDEEYLAEKEQQRQRSIERQRQAEIQRAHKRAKEEAAAKAAEASSLITNVNSAKAKSRTLAHSQDDKKSIADLAREIPARHPPARPGISQGTVHLLASLQHRLQEQLTAAGQAGLSGPLLTNALAIVVAQAAKACGGINNLSTALKSPEAVQSLLVRVLELMKQQAAQARQVSGASGPDAVAIDRATELVGSRAPNSGNVNQQIPTPVQPQPTQLSPASTPTQTTGKISSPIYSNNQPAEPAQSQITHQQQTQAVQQSSLPTSLQTTHQYVAASGTTEETRTHSSMGTSQPQPASGPTQAPYTKERILELLEQAERIPNPTPQIQAAIQQLRAHQERLSLQSRQEDPIPPKSV